MLHHCILDAQVSNKVSVLKVFNSPNLFLFPGGPLLAYEFLERTIFTLQHKQQLSV